MTKRKRRKPNLPRNSNEQVLRRYIERKGHARVRFQPDIRNALTGNYTSYRGAALIVEVPTVEAVKELVEAVNQSILAAANARGFRASRMQVLEATAP